MTAALSGGGAVGQVQERVRSRFPEAAPLPARPGLDDLLRAAGLELAWDGQRYVPPSRGSSTIFSHHTRTRTRVVDGAALPAELADVEARLVTSLRTASFLTLAVDPHRLDDAVDALVVRFGVTAYDLTRALLASLRTEAAESRVVWDVVLRADRQGAPVAHASRLRQLVGQAAQPLEHYLREAPEALLLTDAAPLARYDRMAQLETLADRTTHRPAARWLLIPADGSGPPRLDGHPAPLSSGWLRLPVEWIRHVAGTARRAS